MKRNDKRPEAVKRYKKAGNVLWAAKKLWKLEPKFYFFLLALIPVTVATPLLNGMFLRTLVNGIGEGKRFTELLFPLFAFLLGLLALRILEKILTSERDGRTYYPTSVYQAELECLEKDVLDYESTEKQDCRELLGYVREDANQGNCSMEFFWKELSEILTDLLGILTYASLFAALQPVLLLVILLTASASWFLARWEPVYTEKNHKNWEKEDRKKSYLESISMDFALAKEIRLYGMEKWILKMTRDFQSFRLFWASKCNLRGFWSAVFAAILTMLQNGAAYFYLISSLLRGEMSVGDFVFYFGIVGTLAGYIGGVVTDFAKLANRADKIAYWRAFYDYPVRFCREDGAPLPVSPVRIECRNLSYRYPGAEEDALQSIDLVIEPGESLALVGLNGAGKTTLVKLLCGMYAPTGGEILVNGVPLDGYVREDYYSMISVVFQEIQPVAFTIREYVSSFDPERESAAEDAETALRKAGLWERISSLPNGMETHLVKGVYEDGVDLSGGEMQKLVLARAIYKDGPILILDEPTSALDPIAEDALYREYRSLTRGKTSLYISHRFASTRFCDRIVLLERGRIVESGTHASLMAQKGRYAEMFEAQSKYYKEGTGNA